MKIGLIRASIAAGGGGGGGTRQMLELACGLRDLGHDVIVGCFHLEDHAELSNLYPGLTWRAIDRTSFRHPRSRIGRLNWYWRDMRAVALAMGSLDAVNAHEWPALHAGGFLARKQGIPFVWTRNDPTILESAATRPGTGRLPHLRSAARTISYYGDVADARRARAIVVLDSKSAAVAELVYGRPVRIVRSGPRPFFFGNPDRVAARTRIGVSPDVFLVASVGVMLAHRGFEDLVAAIARIPATVPIRAMIVGSDRFNPSYADQLASHIASAGVSDRVHLLRADIDEALLLDVYTAADLFVHPQDGQTYGLAPLEALAAGTPVVVSTGAGVHEILEGRQGVTLIEPRCPDLLATTIERQARIGHRTDVAATRRWIRSELSRQRYAEAMLDLLSQ